jgi:hypothetical protein
MLRDKLMGANGTAPAAGIEYVGGYTLGFAGSASNITITFGGNLTGGIASSASEGDLVIVYFGTGSGSDRNLVVAGYTEIAELYSNDTYAANLAVAYKFMGETPDTNFVLTGGTRSTADAGAVVVHVFRNVDPFVPTDVTSTTATGTNSVLCNPPAITPSTAGAVVVSGGAGAHTRGDRAFSSSDLTAFLSSGEDDTNDVTVGAGYVEWTSGAVDPAAFTFSNTNSTSYSWAAVTLVLRPLYTGPKPEFIASATTQRTSSGNLTINVPSGTADGDLMVAFMAADGDTTWTGATGWTEVADGGNSPSLRVAYKVASSEPASYTFTSAQSRVTAGSILTYRGASYDAIGSFALNASPLVVTGPTAAADFSVLLVAAADVNESITFGAPIGMTPEVTQNDATKPSYSVFDQYVAAGATGTRSVTSPNSVNVSAIALTIKPA